MTNVDLRDPLLVELRDQGLLNQQQVDEIKEEHQRTGHLIRELVAEMDVLEERRLLEVIAQLLGGTVIDIKSMDIAPDVIRMVPASIARMYNVVPVELDGNALVLATFDLLSPEVVDELAFVLSRGLSFVVALEEDLMECLKQFYGDASVSVGDMLSALEAELEDAGDILEFKGDEEDVVNLEEAASSAPVIRFVNLVLYQAVQDRASDIHFEPFENEFKIRYRVDGALYEMSPPPTYLALPVISRIKVISGLNIAERRLPQDGRIQIKIAGRSIDFRVSTLPTQFGESMVLRVLDRNVVSLDLENLSMPGDVYANFSEDICKPNGIIVLTGPTGSGKTTTLYSALRKINTLETKLLTAEEPVEYDIEGIIQIPVNEAIDLTFARALRAFLRQDPDVIMVGEIRDVDTAQIAIQASLTGHLVFSTLHTNDAPGAITRLIDMGIEPFLISSTLEAVLVQRLLRTICDRCKTAVEPEDSQLEMLGLIREQIGDNRFYFGAGCDQCNNTGYKGRCGIYEYLKISDPVRELINNRQSTVVIKEKAIELGMRTLRDDGIRCIMDGYTTVEEVVKYT